MGKPREEKIFFDTDESWKLELDEFVDCITNNKKAYNGNSEDALKVMALIEAIYNESGYYDQLKNFSINRSKPWYCEGYPSRDSRGIHCFGSFKK